MPSNPQQVKNSIKASFKDLNLLKVIAVRSRRPARNASDVAQTFLPVVHSVASAIPIASPPTQAVISGLLSILPLIDRHSQNKADLACLALRLRQLILHLYNAPITQDPLEQGRRDSIFGILQETFEQLTRLQNCRPESASVTQAIARCSNQIDRYLADYSWSSHVQIHEALAILLRRQQDSVGLQLTAAVALGGVKLVDATGREHGISVTFCTSFQQLNVMLRALFTRDVIEARLQRRYMEQGQYDLCIDDDKQVTRLTNHEWPDIRAGTTIVMRVVFEEEKADFGVKYKCHFCGAVNHIHDKYSLQRHAGSSFNCRVCKRRFQISRKSSLAKRSTQSSDIDSVSRTEAEMHLIRNFYVQRTHSVSPRRVPRGSLHDYLKRNDFNLSERQKSDILFEVADGVEYLHKQGIVHGNLTGDTIFCDDSGRVRIAEIFSEQLPGDARYTAPEFIDYQIEASRPSKAGDIYSYGCVMILVLSGKLPYWWISEEGRVLLEKLKGARPFSPTVEMDETQLNLVRQCLSEEKSRPSIEKVRYLVLVQGFGAVDLTNSVQRLNKDHQNSGGFANVHRCKLCVTDIDASVPQLASRHQLSSITTCDDIAVKVIKFGENPDVLKIINRLFREIKLWLKLEHENIVPFLGVTDGFGSLPALISPWFHNGTLTRYLQCKHKMLSYNAKFALLRNVARGLQYLHSQSIIHGDLSGNNVLIDKNGKASLADFGLSALLPERTSQALLPTNPTCTAPYMAPEYLIFDDDGNMSLVFDPKSDVYSFGGIMLQVLEGKIPYHYLARYEAIIHCISQGIRPKRPSAPVVSDVDWDFIQSCWSRDMERRPSDEAILEFVEGRTVLNPVHR